MKRFIAILTLALTAALSADKASAQDFFGIPMVNTAESGLDDISGSILRFAATEVGIMDLIDLSWFGEQHKIYDYSQCIWNDITFNEHATSDLEGLIAIIALAATETGVIDPDDCPSFIAPNGNSSVGYTNLYSPDTVNAGQGGDPLPEALQYDSDAVLAGGTLSVSDYNGNRILGFNGLPTHDEDSIVLDGSGDAEGVVDPDDCPSIVDLWFELVDAGYTEDEAFEMIEMVMGEGPTLFEPEDIILGPFVVNSNVTSTF
jgi:hypothetical protein